MFKKYSSKGYRVLALAYKDIPKETDIDNYLREEAEKDLIFVGFVVYESPLKGDTKKQIDILKAASY
jgi:magnesium-transporting ATPase (P-type)